MESVNHEKLAEMVDRDLTPAEQSFLDQNPYWADELEAMREQTDGLAALPRMMPPRGDWEHLEARLRAEGLVSDARERWIRVPALRGGLSRAAAAILLFLAGGVSGTTLARTAGPGTVVGALDVAAVSTLDEAAGLVERTEQQYVSSLHRYRQLAEREGRTPGASVDPRRKAEALELLVQASRNALRSAPYDPFINGMLVNALAEQEAIVRQVDRSRDDNWF